MYTPTHFEQNDIAAMHALIDAHPLATVITTGAAGLSANHIPLLLSRARPPLGVLTGHVPRANPLWHENPGSEALFIFHGVDAYISPSWYATTRATGKVVPTWNYTVVHARGHIRFIDDPDWVLAHLTALTDTFEAPLSGRWKIDDAPADFIARLLPNLIGMEVAISSIEGKAKLSQNRSPADRRGVVDGLKNLQDSRASAMAALIEALDTR